MVGFPRALALAPRTRGVSTDDDDDDDDDDTTRHDDDDDDTNANTTTVPFFCTNCNVMM